MTTIAYDGTALAADRASWSGPARRAVRKVFKLRAPDGRRFLIGFSGSGDYAHAVLAWMRGQRQRPEWRDYLKSEDMDRQFAVVIDEQRRVWQLSNQLVYTPSRERIYAYGAGHEFAWGALEAGATAAQAIRIAIKRSDYAGLGVDTVSF
jgi:hypothetical protein